MVMEDVGGTGYMAKKPETRRQRRIRKRLQEKWPKSRFIKIHGGEYQNEGEPDIIGCVEGLFVALEVKEPDNDPTPLQIAVLKEWAKAGACTGVVETPEQTIALIQLARRSSERSRVVCATVGRMRSLL